MMGYSPLGLMICSHGVTDEMHGRAVMIYSLWADEDLE